MDTQSQYWINHHGEQSGPYTAEQLRAFPADERTYVWCVGFDDWRPFNQVPELSDPPAVESGGVVQGYPPVAPAQPQAQPQGAQQPYPPCPPTNLVWAIIATIFCCLPSGVVAIYYATRVSKKYYEGDLSAAERYSEVGAWWCIGSIVAGIALSPLLSLMQLGMMG